MNRKGLELLAPLEQAHADTMVAHVASIVSLTSSFDSRSSTDAYEPGAVFSHSHLNKERREDECPLRVDTVLHDVTRTRESVRFVGAGCLISGLPPHRKESGVRTMAQNTSTPVDRTHSTLTGSPDITKMAQTAIVDIATKAKDQAHAVAQAAADTVDQNRGTAARLLTNAASIIDDSATRLPGGEGVTRLAEAAAEQIDATAQYVREHNSQQMMADLKQFVRRHPGAAVVGAAVVGVLVGRGFRKH